MSIIVVEIDTRKSSASTVFDGPITEQTEHAKQFWKTLILHPHLESRLYSKEISQVKKINTLKGTVIDNSRKPLPLDKKTEEFLEKIRILNQVDEIKRIQTKIDKMDRIKSMRRRQHQQFAKVDGISKSVLTSSVPNLKALAEYNHENANAKLKDEYEFLSDTEGDERNIVKNLDKDDFFDDEDFDSFDYNNFSNNYDSDNKFIFSAVNENNNLNNNASLNKINNTEDNN